MSNSYGAVTLLGYAGGFLSLAIGQEMAGVVAMSLGSFGLMAWIVRDWEERNK